MLRWAKNSISLSSGNRNVWLRSLPGSECRRLWWICRRLRGSARNSWSPFWDLQNMFKNYFQVSLSLLHLKCDKLDAKKRIWIVQLAKNGPTVWGPHPTPWTPESPKTGHIQLSAFFWNLSTNIWSDKTPPFILNDNVTCFIPFLDVFITKNGYQKKTQTN